jgi:mRNA-degrading endonuclease toxin of MazEF toxin-antitoxin module
LKTGLAPRSGNLEQFKIWWADLPKPAERRAGAVAEPGRSLPVEVLLGKTEGLPKICAANFDNLRTILKQNLTERISRLPARRVVEVKRAMGYVLGWDELIDAGD